MDFIDINGVRLAVTISGRPGATPLLLLHGGGGDKSTWDAVAPAFAATHHVYTPDIRGFGDSGRPGKYSFEAMRDDMLALLDGIGADRADLIGHSMGGSLAWLIAQAQPHRIAHLVIEDSPPPKRGVERLTLGPRPAEALPFDWDALVAIAGEFNDPKPEWWNRIDAVTAPTLMLAGGASSHVPQDLFAEALAMLPDGRSRIIEIPVGHHIHRDARDRFLEAVIPFLTT